MKRSIPLALSTLRITHPSSSHFNLSPSLASSISYAFNLNGGGDRRGVSCSRPHRSYEGDGKTTVTILNHEADSPLMVDTYNENGFSLNNGFAVKGPMAIFPKSVLSWDVGSSAQITPESLALFALLEPKLDILVIGVGDNGRQKDIPLETYQMLKKKRINFEILPTDHALTTFNFLNFEKRCVAAALLPPRTIGISVDDTLNNRLDKKRIYRDPEY